MIKKALMNFSKAVMTHTRDISVVHTIDKRVFFDIPLYHEKSLILKDVHIEAGRMVITCHKVVNDGKMD
jgi:hypothetical protein